MSNPLIQPPMHALHLTKFSLRNVSTVVPACMNALDEMMAVWHTLLRASTDDFMAVRMLTSDLQGG